MEKVHIIHLSDEFKDKEKAEAGRKAGEAIAEAYRESQESVLPRRTKSEDIRQTTGWVHCEGEGCTFLTKYAPERVVDGKLLCSKCYREATGQAPTSPPPRIIETPTPTQATRPPRPIPMTSWEIWDNEDPNTSETYPYEVVEITEDESQTLALFVNESDASVFVTCKEEEAS